MAQGEAQGGAEPAPNQPWDPKCLLPLGLSDFLTYSQLMSLCSGDSTDAIIQPSTGLY